MLSMVIVFVMGLRPVTFDKHVASIMFFPPGCHPDVAPARWKFPVARDPLVSPVPTGPVSGDPYVVARRAIPVDNHFVTRRRRCPEKDVYIDGRDQLRCGQRCAVRCKWSKRADGDQCGHAKPQGGFEGFCHHSKSYYGSMMMDPNGNEGFGLFKSEGGESAACRGPQSQSVVAKLFAIRVSLR